MGQDDASSCQSECCEALECPVRQLTRARPQSTHANDAFQGMFAKDESLNRRLVSVTKPSEYLG